MSPHILTPLDCPAGSRLNRVVNSYLYQLRSLEWVVVPRVSLATYDALVTATPADVLEMAGMLFHLVTLNTSLHQLAASLNEAYLLLEEFATENADLETFARTKQDESARADRRSKKKAGAKQASPADLARFGLHTLLAPSFAGGPGEGEKIGTLAVGFLAYHSSLLRSELRFGLRDATQPALPANLTTAAPAPPAGQPLDERWQESDVSLSGPEAAAEFEQLLQECQDAAALFHSIAADDTAGHVRLFRMLVHLVDGDNDDAAEVLAHVPA